MGCLPFTQKNRLVDSCSKWDATSLKGNFHGGVPVPFPPFLSGR